MFFFKNGASKTFFTEKKPHQGFQTKIRQIFDKVLELYQNTKSNSKSPIITLSFSLIPISIKSSMTPFLSSILWKY